MWIEIFHKKSELIRHTTRKNDRALREFFSRMAVFDFEKSPPELGRILHKKIQELLDYQDPYLKQKKFFNDTLMHRYDEFKEIIADSNDPFKTALLLSLSGNIIDFGMQESFDINEYIYKLNTLNIDIDFSKQLRKDIQLNNNILYLGDNAGEIVFDRLFIETITELYGKKDIWFAVRGGPIINDVTLEDAFYVGMNDVAKVISNGYDAPGTILRMAPNHFIDIYNKAGLIISKGQGNFESISDQTQNIYFLLMAKCEVVAEYFCVARGALIVAKSNMQRRNIE